MTQAERGGVLITWSGHYIRRTLRVVREYMPMAVFILVETFSKEWYRLSRKFAELLRKNIEEEVSKRIQIRLTPESFRPIPESFRDIPYCYVAMRIAQLIKWSREPYPVPIYIDITSAPAHGGFIADRISSWLSTPESPIYIVDCARGNRLRDPGYYVPEGFDQKELQDIEPKNISLQKYRQLEMEDEGSSIVEYKFPPRPLSIIEDDELFTLLELVPKGGFIKTKALCDKLAEKREKKEGYTRVKMIRMLERLEREGLVVKEKIGRAYGWSRTGAGDLALNVTRVIKGMETGLEIFM